MEREVGKQIDGYPDYYVSNLGRIKSTKKEIEHILKPFVRNDGGYLYVCLSRNGKVKKYYVHRLVADAFIPNITGMPCVNHRDENPYNNVVSNLEWCDYVYNNNYGTGNKRRSDILLNRGDLSRPVRQLTLEGKLIAVHPSISEGARFSGLKVTTVWRCASGIVKNPRTYRGEYVG